MKRALLCFTIIFTLILGICLPVGVIGFTDTEGTKYETAANVLSVLGFVSGYKDGSFDVSEPMTRAEFATLLARLANLANMSNGNIYFYDVPENHWAKNAINNIAANGLMEGDGNYFRPDDNVTLAEVSRGVVMLLGYTQAATASSYNAVAYQLGIYKNTSIGDRITRGDVLIVLYNALNVDLSVVTKINANGEVDTETVKGKTILTENFDIYRKKGQFTAIGELDLVRNTNENPGYARIDDVQYKLGKGLAADPSALSHNIDFYYEDAGEGDTPTLLYYSFDRNDEVIEVAPEDISLADSTLTEIVYYDENGKRQEQEISTAAKFIVNGHIISDAEKSEVLFDINSGFLKLVLPKNEMNEVVWIQSYDYYIVESPGLTSINLKGGGSIDLDGDKSDLEVSIFDSSGKATTIIDVIADIPVAVAQVNAADGVTYREVHILKTVSGVVTEFDNESMVVDDKTYGILKSLDTSKLNLNLSYTFIIGMDGKIALYDSGDEASVVFGYLTWILNDTKSLSGKLELEILNSNGEKTAYRAADKLSINDENIKSADFKKVNANNPIIKYLYTTEYDLSTPVFKRQLIAYTKNAEGRINALYTPNGNNNDILSYDVPAASRQCKSASLFNFAGQLALKATGFVVATPSIPTVTENNVARKMTAEEYTNWLKSTKNDPEVWPQTYFANDTSYTVEGYNVDEVYEADVIIVTASTDVAYYNENNTYTCIFDNRSVVLNADGEQTYAVTYWQQGTKYTRQLAIRGGKSTYDGTVEVVKNLNRGDCFKIELTSDNSKIKNIALEFQEAARVSPQPAFNNGRQMLYGQIQAVGVNSVVIKPFAATPPSYLAASSALVFRGAGRVSTYVYSRGDREIQYIPNCLAEARVGDWVLYQARNASARVMVIYRDDTKLPDGTPIK